MKISITIILFFSLYLPLAFVFASGSDIRLNSLGFLPEYNKKATITTACSTFSILRVSDQAVVFQGAVTGPFFQKDVNQSVWIADFSTLREPGTYVLEVAGVGRSIQFNVSPDVYDTTYRTAMRAMYLWRCGTAVSGEYQGQTFAHPACHMEDGWLHASIGDGHKDGTGGWHDAGDHGKYVVNAGITVANLLFAWDHFQNPIRNIPLDLPETAPAYPEFLKEIKWETDWLLKMQLDDGSGRVAHKLTRFNFAGFIMPEDDHEKRYFTDWSTAATADFAAVMAMATRYFKPYDANYSATCLAAAQKSFQALKKHPENKQPDLRDFRTGAYTTDDADDRLWAAAELWEATGESGYLKDLEAMAKAYAGPGQSKGKKSKLSGMIDEDWDWGNVRNLGMFTYLLSARPGKNQALEAKVKHDLIAVADSLVKKAAVDVYGRPFAGRYYWGCNGTVARQVLNLQVAYRFSRNPVYLNTALDAIGHLLGRNFYRRSFITGIGHQPPMHPHDRRSGADAIEAPWPGYLVGGGHSATDWKDEEASYQTNEIAINWQAALVYALAGFTSQANQEGSKDSGVKK